MLDLNIVKPRYFPVRLGKYNIDVEPCKVKTLNKFMTLDENTNISDLTVLCSEILNKNKTKFVIPKEIIENLSIDQMTYLLKSFFEWQAEVKKSDPN